MELKDYRAQIDAVDDELVRLFRERMRISGRIAVYKREHGLPVRDETREREKLAALTAASDPFREDVAALYERIFERSRAYQARLLGGENAE